MKRNKPKTKVCSRCKKERPLTDFKNEIREAVSGKFLWIYPWCNDCSLEVKTKWGVNWIGGTKDGYGRKNRSTREKQNNKKENKHNISGDSRRRSNKKVHIQRVETSVSESGIEQHKDSTTLRRRSNNVRDKCRSGRVIKTLKKTKDYKESV